ncbi:MAG: hypothetical protein LBU32_20460 [Clostridiales bacterium]|jgi:hypothetical protein|nr:hypothetical protein [Clostridiales bacterium]
MVETDESHGAVEAAYEIVKMGEKEREKGFHLIGVMRCLVQLLHWKRA